jgi:hypothetical protein
MEVAVSCPSCSWERTADGGCGQERWRRSTHPLIPIFAAGAFSPSHSLVHIQNPFLFCSSEILHIFPVTGIYADEQEQQREVPFYAERLLCYQCYHALGGLRFFAAKGDEQAYQMTRAIILQKLGAFAR